MDDQAARLAASDQCYTEANSSFYSNLIPTENNLYSNYNPLLNQTPYILNPSYYPPPQYYLTSFSSHYRKIYEDFTASRTEYNTDYQSDFYTNVLSRLPSFPHKKCAHEEVLEEDVDVVTVNTAPCTPSEINPPSPTKAPSPTVDVVTVLTPRPNSTEIVEKENAGIQTDKPTVTSNSSTQTNALENGDNQHMNSWVQTDDCLDMDAIIQTCLNDENMDSALAGFSPAHAHDEQDKLSDISFINQDQLCSFIAQQFPLTFDDNTAFEDLEQVNECSIDYSKIPHKKKPKLKLATCKCNFKCREKLTEMDRGKIFSDYWMKNFEQQRKYLVEHIVKVKKKKSALTKNGEVNKNRLFTLEYYLENSSGKVRVCKNFFQATLDVGERTIYHNLAKAQTGKDLADGRGKQTSLPEQIAELLRSHFTSKLDSKPLRSWTLDDIDLELWYKQFESFCRSKWKSCIISSAAYKNFFRNEFSMIIDK